LVIAEEVFSSAESRCHWGLPEETIQGFRISSLNGSIIGQKGQANFLDDLGVIDVFDHDSLLINGLNS